MFKFSYLYYLLAAFLLLGFYTVSLQVLKKERGFRLPLYYNLNGVVLPIGNSFELPIGTRILSINGESPATFRPVFSENKKMLLLTKEGPQWIKSVPNSLRSILFDFKYLIVASFIFILCALWFYRNTRDAHLVIFNAVLGLFCALGVSSLSHHSFVLFWQFSIVCIVPALLNMGLRTTGRYLYGYLAIGEVNFVLFFSLLLYVSRKSAATLHKLYAFWILVLLLVVIAVLGMQFIRVLQRKKDKSEKIKQWVLFLGSFFFIFISFLSFIFALQTWLPHSALLYSAISVIVLPVTLIYGTYRLQIVPFQIVLSRSMAIFIQAVFFSCLYGVAVLLINFLIPQREGELKWIFQIVLLVALVFFLDPLQYFLSSRLKKEKFWSDEKLELSLQRLVSIISSHRRIQTAIYNLLEEISQSLGLQKIGLLLSRDSFPELELRTGILHRVPENSRFWNYLRNNHIVITDYLTYGGGVREELFRFLSSENYMLALGIQKKKNHTRLSTFLMKSYKLRKGYRQGQKRLEQADSIKSALLIGYPEKNKSLKISETRYLHEATRLCSILIQNYTILVAEIEKRQQIRELQIAGQLQRKLPEIEQNKIKHINFDYSSKAAVSVTGDYFDLFPLKNNQVACLLGDVSGHGLGTGYLASSLQAIVRSHLQGGASLSETVNAVNHFFLEHYQGNEFLTLVAFIMNPKKRSVEYLNAAHPSPFLLLANNSKLTLLNSFQPVLGVLPAKYKTEKLKISPGDRLFLYSDGVNETFNPENIPFGEKRLVDFIEKSKADSLSEIIPSLGKELSAFRGSSSLTDDTTMAVLEMSDDSVFNIKNIGKVWQRIDKLIPVLKNTKNRLDEGAHRVP